MTSECNISNQLKRYEEALLSIARWFGEFPPGCADPSGRQMSYGEAYGSNGERDFMRAVAIRALVDLDNEAEVVDVLSYFDKNQHIVEKSLVWPSVCPLRSGDSAKILSSTYWYLER